MRTIAICFIIALMLACPVAAYAKDGGESPEAEKKAAVFDLKAFTDEIAERVRAKALFQADVTPQLQQVIDKNSDGRYVHYPVNDIVEKLWQLRAAPEMQKRMFDTILAAKDPQDLRKTLDDLRYLLENTSQIVQELQYKEEKKRREESRENRKQMSESEYRVNSMVERLEAQKRQEAAMGKATNIALVLEKAELRFFAVEPYLEQFDKLTGNPESLNAAISLIKKRNIPRLQVIALLEKLAVSPKAALADIANVDEFNRINTLFRFAMNTEGEEDVIKLPVAAILPKAADELTKSKTIPLAASTFKRTGKLLQTRQLEKVLLIDEEHGLPLRSDKAGENEHLVFLNPGERLFMVYFREGTPVLAGTPLDAVATTGPHVLEYKEDMRRYFGALENTPELGLRPKYLMAAACEADELRKHLASLTVVRSEREKSLYGTFADFEWKKEDNPYGAKELSEIPSDSPGATLRFADIRDVDFFLALAPLADKEGLERLMGPIRGIWVQDRPVEKTPWVELRYTPGGKTESSELGKSPILELNKAALESIIAAKRSLLEYAWAAYDVREETEKTAGQENRRNVKPDYATKLPEALKNITARFDGLAAKGFVSPWDMGSAVYYLHRAGNDAALVEILKALCDDTSQSSAKRVRAMRSALRKK